MRFQKCFLKCYFKIIKKWKMYIRNALNEMLNKGSKKAWSNALELWENESKLNEVVQNFTFKIEASIQS